MHNYIDHTWAQWIWYPACAIFVVSAVIDSHSTNKKPSKIPLFDFFEKLSLLPAIMIFGSAFIINYYNVAFSWWWAGFVIFAVYFPVFMVGIRKYLEKEKSYTPEQIKKSKKNCLKYVLFYWLIDLFYMSIFNYWQVAEQIKTPWLVLQFVFGGLAMVYIFYNLTRVFLANGEKHWWGLLQDFVLGILTTIYLIFLLPNDSGLQSITATIIAAVYGGLLTLVGVAWTIRDADTKRKEDLERVEKERKEEERKKYRPFVNCWLGAFEGKKYDILTDNFLVNTDKVSNQQTELLSTPNYIRDAYFSNTDFSDFYVWGMRLDNQGIGFDSIRFVKKGSAFVLNFSKKPLFTEKPIEEISIILEDMLENLYELPLKFEFDESTNTYTIVGNDPSLLLNYTDMENNDEQNNVRKGISTVHNQSTNKRKWLY